MLTRKILYLVFSLLVLLGLLQYTTAKAITTSERLAGRILLQVEEHGEAWYINPSDLMRYFLGRPSDAFLLMREQGAGTTNQDLVKIPIGLGQVAGNDSDGDGLPDLLEDAVGTSNTNTDTDQDGFSDYNEINNEYNPLGPGRLPIDKNFSAKQAGRILLQVEAHGEAWYISPTDNKRYFLGRPEDAFSLMRSLGLGITNSNLNEIIARTPGYDLSSLELKIHEQVNQERIKAGLLGLTWNNQLAQVAREHSENLARENEKLTEMSASCDFPMIHHEGYNFGLYNRERLNERGVYYYQRLGENIALITAAEVLVKYGTTKEGQAAIEKCQSKRESLEVSFVKRLDQADSDEDKLAVVTNEINTRKEALIAERELKIAEINWQTEEEIVETTIDGWMKSEGHRENIIKAEYDETGIGLAEINGYIITTQVFIKRTGCGYLSGACCEEEGYYPYCYEPYICVSSICEQ